MDLFLDVYDLASRLRRLVFSTIRTTPGMAPVAATLKVLAGAPFRLERAQFRQISRAGYIPLLTSPSHLNRLKIHPS